MSENRSKPDQYQLRFPSGMRERIKASADKNNRSMNAEIIAVLEEFYGSENELVSVRQGTPSVFSVDELRDFMRGIKEDLKEIKKRDGE